VHGVEAVGRRHARSQQNWGMQGQVSAVAPCRRPSPVACRPWLLRLPDNHHQLHSDQTHAPHALALALV
jgi:hypothetical protein